MGYNFVTNIESCYIEIPKLLYYSHIPPAVVVLLLGVFVLFKSEENKLAGRILFSIAVIFSIWVAIEGVLWFLYSSANMMFFWSFLGLLYVLIHILSLYFVYVVIDKKDISLRRKYFLIILLLPIIFLIPTKYNLTGFDTINCQAFEGDYFIFYRYFLGILSIIWMLILLLTRLRKSEQQLKKQILLLGVGIVLFLLLFSWSEISGSLTENFEITQYGLFGMPIFLGFLTYLIVKYNTFNIKLLGSEALVAALVILIGSQFAFIQNPINQILTGSTLFLAIVFGYILVRSVRKEVREREQLAVLGHELEHANQELKELDKVKSEFISIVSHQLRTPLSVTKGYVSMILEGVYGAITDKIKDPLQKVYVSNEGLIALVNNLLDLSRMEAGTIKYDFVDADLVKMVDEMVMGLELEAKHRNLYLKWTRPTESLPMIKADTIKLKQVIEILIENSLKYTPQGGVNVSLAKDTNSLIFKVEDTGIGIEPHETDHLFNKFGRGKEGSRVNATGLGLGLYAAKQIVLKHNGDIWAESDGVGKGSRFLVRLPIA